MSRHFALLGALTILTLAAIVMVAAGVIVSRRMRRLRERGAPQGAFTLHDLRQMRDAGQSSEAEFERMRAALIGDLRGGPDGKSADAGRQGRA